MESKKQMHRARGLLAGCLALLVLLATGVPCLGSGKLFAIVAKSVSDRNFVRVYEAARAEAEGNGDRVILVGGTGKAHFRNQDAQIQTVLKLKPDGLAISVLHSKYLAENSFVEVRRVGIPVVTYDSDFTGEYSCLRAGYVGTDNRALGCVLAREARMFRPWGGKVAIMTGGLDDTNLNDRIQGVLNGLDIGGVESAWTLHDRSPVTCRDNYGQALNQLETLLDEPDIDVIISVGAWAQMAPEYEKLILRYKASLDNGEKILLFAGANSRQLELFEKGLNHVNIGLDFEEMGRLVYRELKTLAEGGDIPLVTYTPVTVFSSARSVSDPNSPE